MNSPKSNPDNVAHQPVEAEFLRHGIFVTDLDRPWIGTPFPLQGFLIENDEQIAQLQQLCRIVYVDRRRSIGDQYAALVRERERRMPGHAEDDFLAIAKRIRAGQALPASQGKSPSGIDAGMEAEMLRSAPIIDDVQKTLESVGIAIEAGDAISLDKVFSLVDEMAAGVERNPDALIWLTRLKATDRYSYDHAVDVSVHLMVFGRFLGLGRDDVKELGRAGLMQDVGKVHVPSGILGKAGPLTSEEFQVVQSHVASSLALLLGQPSFPSSLLSIVAEHHERYDGTGYPRSLAGDRISMRSEMAGMVDTYCAMTRRRAFSEAVSSQKALESLSRMRGVKFREVIVDQFVQCIGLYPVGTLVELSSGEVGIVIQQNRVIRERPRLMVLMSADKTLKRRPTYVDLMQVSKTGNGKPCRIVQALPSNAYGIDPAEFFLD